ncbi:MAG: DUF4395 domain-containing protein, partial [Actinomycetes bacterium]
MPLRAALSALLPAVLPAKTSAGLFSFPDPVNETSARTVAGGVVGMTATAVVLDQPWVMWPLAYGFAARVATGPKLSPLGQLATRVVGPRLQRRANTLPSFSPGPPKRLAQGIGFTMSTTALVLHYGFGRRKAAKLVLTGLMAAASLEAFAGYCVACRMFPLL